jgi:hypothetical protein
MAACLLAERCELPRVHHDRLEIRQRRAVMMKQRMGHAEAFRFNGALANQANHSAHFEPAPKPRMSTSRVSALLAGGFSDARMVLVSPTSICARLASTRRTCMRVDARRAAIFVRSRCRLLPLQSASRGICGRCMESPPVNVAGDPPAKREQCLSSFRAEVLAFERVTKHGY